MQLRVLGLLAISASPITEALLVTEEMLQHSVLKSLERNLAKVVEPSSCEVVPVAHVMERVAAHVGERCNVRCFWKDVRIWAFVQRGAWEAELNTKLTESFQLVERGQQYSLWTYASPLRMTQYKLSSRKRCSVVFQWEAPGLVVSFSASELAEPS